MITNVKPLNISKSKAQKILDEAIEQSVKEKVLVDLLPTDWTVERLREKGLSERQARATLTEMVKKGLAYEVRYRRTKTGSFAIGYRAK